MRHAIELFLLRVLTLTSMLPKWVSGFGQGNVRMNILKPAAVGAFAVFASAASAEERAFDLHGFDKVVVNDGVTAEIARGVEYEVTATALRGELERLRVDVDGDTLHISRRQTWGFFAPGRRDRFEVTILLPELREVESNAGSTVRVTAPSDVLARVSASAGAGITVSDADLANVELISTSGSSVRIDGACDEVTAEASSGASVRAQDLQCQTAVLKSTSGASLSAYASETARANSSSGASIRLHGGAELLEREVTGGASIRAD